METVARPAMKRSEVINVGPGPAGRPTEVVEQEAKDLLNIGDSGMGITEISHRGEIAKHDLDSTIAALRKLLDVPDNYKILFMQGGARMQFSAIVYNFFAHCKQSKVANYINTGSWSQIALDEARRLGVEVNEIYAEPRDGGAQRAPDNTLINEKLTNDPMYLYYCVNETITGTEFRDVPRLSHKVDIICDASSHLLSRPIDVAAHAVIFASSQKNIGQTGLTVVIVREDIVRERLSAQELLEHKLPVAPSMLDWKMMDESRSLLNTPPIQSLHSIRLYAEWLLERGGLKAIALENDSKAEAIYEVLDFHKDLFVIFPALEDRSRVNIVFKLVDESLTNKFIEFCENKNIRQLKGHRKVGGVRISLYNNISLKEAKKIAEICTDFAKEYSHSTKVTVAL